MVISAISSLQAAKYNKCLCVYIWHMTCCYPACNIQEKNIICHANYSFLSFYFIYLFICYKIVHTVQERQNRQSYIKKSGIGAK